MDFEASIAAVESLAGVDVEASVWGAGDGGHLVADLSGNLRRITSDVELPEKLRDAEEAAVFAIGEADPSHLSLWPSRFVGSRRELQRTIVIHTLDGVVRIGPRSRP